jgi:hypothetical protein
LSSGGATRVSCWLILLAIFSTRACTCTNDETLALIDWNENCQSVIFAKMCQIFLKTLIKWENVDLCQKCELVQKDCKNFWYVTMLAMFSHL